MRKIWLGLKSKFFWLLLLLLVLSYSVWWQIPNLAIRGDGFVYLIDRVRNGTWVIPQVLGQLRFGSLLLARTVVPIFRTNMSLYWITELIVMFFINILVYLLVYVISKKPIVAFSAALIQSVSFFGNWDMYAGGIYAYFTERVPNMIFMILSMLFLHLYLSGKKVKFILFSALLYLLGVWVWHWSLFFTGFFVVYPVLHSFFNKIPKKSLILNFVLSSYYLAISVLITFSQNITEPGLNPRWNFSYFLSHPEIFNYWEYTIRQLVYVSEYTPIFKGFVEPLRYVNTPLHYLIGPQNAVEITSGVVIVYILASLVIFWRLPRLRTLLLTLIIATLSTFFMNVFIGQYAVGTQSGSNRYLYIPAFYLSIFWALFLWALCWVKKGWLNFVGILLLGIYFGLNYWLIFQNFEWVMEKHVPTKQVWAKAVEIGYKSPEGTLIILPYYETGQYEAEFLNDVVGKTKVTFATFVPGEDEIGLAKAVSKSKQVIKITYDKFCRCAKTEEISSK